MNELIMEGSSQDPKENLKKKPRKGILKSSSSFESKEPPTSTPRCRDKGRNSKETKWDEKNILETLHPPNKDYGHMKIEEPKTPYEKNCPDETDSIDPDDLSRRLLDYFEDPSKPLKCKASENEEEESDDEQLSPDEKERKKQFESKRKAHYNEFLIAKRAMKELMEEEDDEEEDVDMDKETEGESCSQPETKDTSSAQPETNN